MLNIIKSRHFANGAVYALSTTSGHLIETTDTFLPYYTKFCINGTNRILQREDGEVLMGSRAERWMIGVSVASGCPVGCKFCATAQLPRYRPLKAHEIVDQVVFVVTRNNQWPKDCQEFKINYTRMGDFGMNPVEVREAVRQLTDMYPNAHHYLSTIGIKGMDFSWIKGNITLQISLHSLDEARRDALIPNGNKMSIVELGQIRTQSNLKTTINLTMVDKADWSITELRKHFDPEHFFVKISPINRNCTSEANGLSGGVIQAANMV
jgi:23S rRNA (adenine2503-C2)-methyltransferase